MSLADPPYPNVLMRQLMEGIRQVLGPSGLDAALREAGLVRFAAFPLDSGLETDVTMREYARLHQAIETMTGRAHRTTLRRIGRAAFDWGLENPPAPDPFAPLVLRTMPQKLRQRAVLTALAAGLQEMVPGSDVSVDQEDGHWIVTDDHSAAAFGRESEAPVCHAFAGYLEAAMAFATGQSITSFAVDEIACRATGATACRFEIALNEPELN